jgi:site-specific recombinase XerD
MTKLTAVPDHLPELQPGEVPPGWPELRKSFMLGLRVAGRTDATRTTYGDSVDAFARWYAEHAPGRPVEYATRDDLRGFLVWMEDRGLTANTRATRFRALRALYKFVVSDEIIPASPMANITTPRVTEERVPPALTPEQVDAMVAKCRPRSTFIGARDRALLLLISSSGLRAAEALGLTEDDLVLDSETPYAIVQKAKGGRVREASVSRESALAVLTYLRQRAKHKAAHRPELWLSRTGAPMTVGGLRKVVHDAGARVGLDVHTHALRHTATNLMLARGMQEHDVAVQLGHKGTKQLARYGAARATERSRASFFRTQS